MVQEVSQGAAVVVFKWAVAKGWPVEYVSPDISQFGYCAQDFLSGHKSYADIVHPEDRDRLEAAFAAAGEQGAALSGRAYRIVLPDGRVRWVRHYAMALRDGRARARHYQGYVMDVTMDVTGRARAQQSRRGAVSHLDLLERAAAPIIVHGAGRLLYANPAAVRLFGAHSADELIGNAVDSRIRAVALGDRGEAQAALVCPGRVVRDDGQELEVEMCGMLVTWYGQAATQVQLRDLAPAHGAERDLRRSEEVLRNTFAQAAVGLAHVAPNGRWLRVNRRLCRITGYSEAELLQGRFQDITHPDDLQKEQVLLHKLLAGESSGYQLDKRFVHKNGSTVWTTVTAALARSDSGAPDFLILVIEDITARKDAEKELRRYRDHLKHLVEKRTSKLRALNEQLREEIARRRQVEQELRESEERFRRLSEAAWEGIAITCDDRILDANRAFAAMFGYELPEVTGRLLSDFIMPERRAESPHTAADGRERVGRRKDGSLFPMELHSEPTFYRGYNVTVKVIRDLTQRLFLEEQRRLHQAELARVWRLSTMGEMASGLAHELNQPLAAIMNYTRGSLRRMESAAWDIASIREAIGQVAVQAERAGEIIRRLRHFMRLREARQGSQDVNKLVEEVVRFVVAEIRRLQVKVALDLAEALPPVRIDSIQIEQVVLNLVRNAIEAMEAVSPERRQLTIRTALRDERFIEVQVSDRGTGLADSVYERLFLPFFTTKPNGTGLGLAVSQSIIEAHGGRLWAENDPRGGATFHFTLLANKNGQK